MRVLLISPPDKNTIIADNPTIIDEERGHNPPLGILYLAASLEKHTNHEIHVLDSQVEEMTYEELEQAIAGIKPDVVGITAMTFTLIDVIKTLKIVRKLFPEVKIILGGPHAHIYPKETASLPEVDYVVLGEGEETIVQLLNNIHDEERLKGVPGLVFRDKTGHINHTALIDYIQDLDKIPFPARHLTPVHKYSSLLAKRSPVTTMFTSRGCPYKCYFCDRPHMGKKFRYRSARNVVDEMQACREMGIKEMFIYDDTFTLNRKRVLDICNEIIDRNLDIVWDIRARVDTVDREMLARLKDAHCERIHYGVEAGTEKVINALGKGITLKQVRDAFRLTKEVGISTLAYFMIGSPTETREDILETIRLAKELNPDYVNITITTPYPATKLYAQALEEKVIPYDYWHEFAKNPTTDLKVHYWEKELSRDDLMELVNMAYKSFYVRPGYIIKQLFATKSLDEAYRKTKAGIKVLSKVTGAS